MTPFAIAGLQLHVSESEDNLPRLAARLDSLIAHYPWVELVLMSELAAFGPSPSKAQPLPGPAEAAFCAMAAKHGVWLIPGSIFELTPDGVYNTTPVIDPKGKVIARYRKMFPFLPYETGVLAGDEPCVFDIPEVGRFGVSICYDMWFPETTRTLAALGAEVILHPSMTTTIDRDVELAIARASAAQNQCFFVDINGVGGGGNGRSIICGPSGEVRHQAGGAEEMMPLEIDLAEVRRNREQGMYNLGQPLKSFRDRKVQFPLYGETKPGERSHGEYLDRLGPLTKPARARRSSTK